jgi:glycine cleavage system H protein
MVAIFVLTLFIFFISVDLIVLKFQGKSHPAFESPFPQFDSSIFERNSFTIPSNIFFSKGHTWLKKNNDGLISVGIDEFGMMALGALSILNCASTGKEIKRGEMIFEGAYGNKIVKFLSPVNGIVKSVNRNIIGKKISNPYETWGVKLASKDFPDKQKGFLSGTEASDWIKKEYVKLKDFINSHSPKIDLAGATMFDGGSLSDDAISSLLDRSANDFEKEFLSL